MYRIKFYLRDAHAESTTIYMRYNYTHEGKKHAFKYGIGARVNPSHWYPGEMKLKTNVRPRTAADYNRKINDEIDRHSSALERVLSEGLPSREKMDRELRPGGGGTLADHFEQLISDRENGRELTRSGTQYLPATITSYRATLAWIRKFKPKVRPEDVDMNYYHELIAFMNAQDRSANLIGGRIKHIKMLLRHLYHKGITQNLVFDNPAFKKIGETADTVYLNDEELACIDSLDLTGTLDRVRDLFLLGCYTGLRFQDYDQLQSVEGDIVKIVTRKTSETVYIPMHRIVKRILAKYGGRAPAGMSNQKMNEYLKEIAIKAKITEKETFRITRGGKVRRETFEKWQKVTTHTARRSFATNLYLAGFDTISIMRITGHRTEDSFLKYIKVSKRENAKRMLKHPYFK